MNENWGPKIKNKQALNEDVQQTFEFAKDVEAAFTRGDIEQLVVALSKAKQTHGEEGMAEIVKDLTRNRPEWRSLYWQAVKRKKFLNTAGNANRGALQQYRHRKVQGLIDLLPKLSNEVIDNLYEIATSQDSMKGFGQDHPGFTAKPGLEDEMQAERW